MIYEIEPAIRIRNGLKTTDQTVRRKILVDNPAPPFGFA